MGQAVFPSIRAHAKLPIGVTSFRHPADLASMKRLPLVDVLLLERRSQRSLPSHSPQKLSGEIDQVVDQGRAQGGGHGKGLPQGGEDHQQEAEDGEPGNPHGKDKEHQHPEVGVHGGKGQKQGEVQECVGAAYRRAPEGQAHGEGNGCAKRDAPQVENRQPGGSHLRLEPVTEVEEKEQGKEDPDRTQGLRDEDPGHQTPDLSLKDEAWIQFKDRQVARCRQVKKENERVEKGNVPDQSGDRDPVRKGSGSLVPL